MSERNKSKQHEKAGKTAPVNHSSFTIHNSPLLPRLRFPDFRDAGEWEVITIGKIGRVSMCKRVMKHETKEEGDIPFYKIGTFGNIADAFISRELFEKYRRQYPFPKEGDILISAAGTIGRLVVYNGADAYFQDSNIVWIDNDERLVVNPFLFYCYNNVNWKTDANTIARLYNDNLRRIKISIPSLPEQQKIADCLSSLDELIELEARQCEALWQHKKGLMQQLFPREGETTPRLRFPEFRDAGEWEVKRLGEFCVIQTGRKDANEGHENGIYPFFTCAENHIYSNLYSFDCEAILVAGNANVGQTKYYKGKFEVYQRTYVLTDFSDINSQYLYSYLGGNLQNDMALQVQTSAMSYIKLSMLKTYKVPAPTDPSEQQKIADCLSSLDELIELRSQKVEALKQHKKGLMQQLFPQEVA